MKGDKNMDTIKNNLNNWKSNLDPMAAVTLDLISKETTIKELEEQLYFNNADEGVIFHGTAFWNSDLVKRIILNDVPSIEIVRCKYCEHYRKDQPCYSNDENTYFFCLKLGRYMEEDDFCSYGRRQI